jgi:arylsulfatase A-like enzyme
VVPGARDEVVSNIDLAPTFEDLAGLEPAAYRSGTSLVPTFGDTGVDRRDVMFVEHTWAPSLGFDPDRSYSGGTIDRIPSYVAARSRTGLLVRLDLDPGWDEEQVAWEYYDLRDADHERTNSFSDPAKQEEVTRLRTRLEEFLACRTLRGDDRVPARCRDLTHAGG